MNISASLKRLVLVLFLAIMSASLVSLTALAQSPSGQSDPAGDRGGVRGGGSPVQVVVKLNDAPVAGVTVTFKSKSKPGINKTTDSDGVATINLLAGSYTISASNDSGSATKTVTVKTSTTTLTVGLALAPATP